ncbi:TetR/AcrR family transcriptional regulator [Streptomyces sp. NPDC059740]|uniref:TetR/AcrR family transcriptional regulator n=1 Tax=Streptomyces sp. NPDC059740 TaxID=3346926 RepID=UPI00365C45E0
MAARPSRAERAHLTREQILDTAERLFAEHGVFAVSNRQISEAAGQGNTAAVGYHFGTKTDLVRALIRRHAVQTEVLRCRMVAAAEGATDVRTWVSCLVRPVTDHLAELGGPTWYARFGAQVMADPVLREVMSEEALSTPCLQRIITELDRCLPHVPAEVKEERDRMAGLLIVHVCAERERALADDSPTPRATWQEAGSGLVDALVGLWTAPTTTR